MANKMQGILIHLPTSVDDFEIKNIVEAIRNELDWSHTIGKTTMRREEDGVVVSMGVTKK